MTYPARLPVGILRHRFSKKLHSGHSYQVAKGRHAPSKQEGKPGKRSQEVQGQGFPQRRTCRKLLGWREGKSRSKSGLERYRSSQTEPR